MPSPVRAAGHSRPHATILWWLGTYGAATPGVWTDDNVTVRLDLDNEVQPDAMLSIDPEAGGRSRLSADDYVEGAPELIVEIAASSAAIDLHDKLRAYRRNGVQEYVVWRVLERQIDWFVLSDDEYRPLNPGAAGMLESRVFPGLRLAVDALLQGDIARVLSELQNGVRSPEHAAFVERLRSAGDARARPTEPIALTGSGMPVVAVLAALDEEIEAFRGAHELEPWRRGRRFGPSGSGSVRSTPC